MVEIKDILLKAAEDVQSGMWCAGSRFAEARDPQRSYAAQGSVEYAEVLNGPVDALLNKYRCAEGSVILATRLLGGVFGDALQAIDAVETRLTDPGATGSLWGYNDMHLSINKGMGPFEAGQELAELFRKTAEAL